MLTEDQLRNFDFFNSDVAFAHSEGGNSFYFDHSKFGIRGEVVQREEAKSDPSCHFWEMGEGERVTFVDLCGLEFGDRVKVYGYHRSAEYLIAPIADKVEVWGPHGKDAIQVQLTDLNRSIPRELGRDCDWHEGLRIWSIFSMPYFDQDKDGHTKQPSEDSFWVDTVRSIRLYRRDNYAVEQSNPAEQ